MRLTIAALLVFFATQQKLPSELQVSQLEDPRVRSALIVVAGTPQNPVITNNQLPATQLEQQQRSQPLDATFNVNFHDAPIRPALTGLAQYHGLNLSMSPDVTGTLTADLNYVTLQQALDVMLPPLGLQYRIENGMLKVEKLQLETRTFKFDYVTTSRSLSRSLSASSTAGGGGGASSGAGGVAGGGVVSGGGGGGGSSASLSGSEQTNLLQDIETALQTLKSPEGKISFNRMAGIIFATDYPRFLDTVGLYLETIQTAVHRQVVIEAKIIEVKLNSTNQVGINWTAVLGNALRIEQSLAGTPGFQITATHGDFTAVISALTNQGNVNVLSSPTISTLNNQPAIMRVGTQDVFFTTTTQVDPRTGTIIQSSIVPSTINEGVVLDVTPQISDDGIIVMNIHPTITERTGQATSPRGDSVPIVDVRETDQIVRIKEGETVVISGLISDRHLVTTDKVPLLGDIPLLGGLFRRTSTENRKSDLVILLTPRILDIRSAVDYTRSRIENQERLKAEKP